MPSANLHYILTFRKLLSSFFVNQKWNFETSKPASSNRRTQQRFVNMPGTVLDVTITWAEMKILKEKNEMDSLCFKGFLAQLDFKFTQGSKNQTHLTLV